MSRAAPATRGARPPGRSFALPMASAGVVPRLLVALLVVNGLKLLARFLIVATAPMASLIPLFAVYNAIAAAPFALWAMNAPPLPTTARGALRRAAITTLAMQVGLGLPDTALHVRELSVRTPDTVQLVLQVLIQSMPHVMTGLLELAVVTAVGFAILKLRMPRPARPRPASTQTPSPAATPRKP